MKTRFCEKCGQKINLWLRGFWCGFLTHSRAALIASTQHITVPILDRHMPNGILPQRDVARCKASQVLCGCI
jgi:hypothetical protein